MSDPVDPTRWARIERHLDDILDVNASDRERALAELEAEDVALAREVRELLRADERAAGVLDSAPALRSPAELAQVAAASRRIGDVVDAYRLVDVIGHGGMGDVFRAERADGQFEQSVALKMIRRGMGTEENVLRFRQERQILARLEHPAITRLIDGGVTDDARPYLVMELVDGEPLTEYVQRRNVSLDDRLALFDRVCEAVGYAHRHLVVHRDLKPTNVLVTPDGDVKLLDFGIAKLVESEDADGLTRVGSYVMTPEYAAPEQVREDAITTATDVYALGAILYELISGRRAQHVPSTSRRDLESAILETSPEALPSSVDRDLSLIVFRALEKEPEERYPTAEALREDLARYRRGLPIVARAPSASYRLRKFVRRNRAPVITTALVLVALLAGGVAVVWQAEVARRAAVRATAVKELLLDVFRGADPNAGAGEKLSAADVLRAGMERIDVQLGDDPELRAEVLFTVGTLLTELGEYDSAHEMLDRVAELRGRHGYDGPEARWETLDALGTALLQMDRYDEADSVYALALDAIPGGIGEAHPLRARALNNLGVLKGRMGEYEAAEAHYREALAIDRARYGEEHPEVATDYSNLATVVNEAGRRSEADSLHRHALELRRRIHAGDHTDIAASLHNVGTTKKDLGELEAAERYIDDAIEMKRRLYDGDHPSLATSLGVRGQVLSGQNRLDEADAQLAEALEMEIRLVGEETSGVARGFNDLGILAYQRGDFALARDRFERAMQIYEQLLGPEHASVATIMGNVATLERLLGRVEDARARYVRVLELHRARYGDDHPEIVNDLNNIGFAERILGNPERAIERHEEALEMALRLSDGDDSDGAASSRSGLAAAFHAAGRLEEAEPLYRVVVARYEESRPPGDPRTVGAWTGLGRALVAMGRAEEAVPLLREAFRTSAEEQGEESVRTAVVEIALGECLTAMSRWDEAEERLSHAHRILVAARGADHYDTRDAATCLEALAARR